MYAVYSFIYMYSFDVFYRMPKSKEMLSSTSNSDSDSDVDTKVCK